MSVELITNEEFEQITPAKPLPASITDKIRQFCDSIPITHEIDKSKYDVIYTTSDIHADVYKLNKLLSSAGLIDSTGEETRDTILNPIHWLKPRTLFIIVGDLVDGSREISEIPDAKGDIELVLHTYIFNLRIKALQNNSDILFTIGNHDYHTVIKENASDTPHFYNSFVHQSAKTFFSSREIRRSCLLPFYSCSPYFILSVDNELAFVHGGLHMREFMYVKDMTDNIIYIQKLINSARDFSSINIAQHLFLSNLGYNSEMGSPLWTRFYSFGTSYNVCTNLASSAFKTVIVGHCQTDSCSKGNNMSSILKNPKFSDCNKGGCVLIGCDTQTDGSPSLVFVDISMSSAFRNTKKGSFYTISPADLKEIEDNRRAEILKMEHDSTLDDSKRYYNKISREKIGGTGPNMSLLYWQALQKTSGGKRSKTVRNKNRRKFRKVGILSRRRK